MTNITTTCKAQGVYDYDITAYTCTRPCPLPKIPDPLLMTHNWTNTTENAEYRDTLVFSCKFGQKFVSKRDFLIGSSQNLITNITTVCQITGWFNDTSGAYTCTRNCGPPTNYSLFMKNNWNSTMQIVPYDTTFR